MANWIQAIALEKLVAHPDNPNRQSGVNFAKLVRNIERTGRYEPLVVRPCPERESFYQIINGHHRWRALAKLGYEAADCVVWEIDDEQTDILLATLNRLGGTDELGKKLKLLKRLNHRLESGELSKLLPLKRAQIERLTSLRLPSRPAKMDAKSFANPTVFFLDDGQQEVVENALSLAEQKPGCGSRGTGHETKAARRAGALTCVAQCFIDNSTVNCENVE